MTFLIILGVIAELVLVVLAIIGVQKIREDRRRRDYGEPGVFPPGPRGYDFSGMSRHEPGVYPPSEYSGRRREPSVSDDVSSSIGPSKHSQSHRSSPAFASHDASSSRLPRFSLPAPSPRRPRPTALPP